MFSKQSRVALFLVAVLAPSAIACGQGSSDDETESVNGAASAEPARPLSCQWENIDPKNPLDARHVGTTYELHVTRLYLSGALKKIVPSGSDPSPDTYDYEKADGDARLYVTDGEKLPDAVTHGDWSIVRVLSLPADILEGKSGRVSIESYVKKGDAITPFAKSAPERLALEAAVAAAKSTGRSELEVSRQILSTVSTLSCKAPKQR